MDMLGVGCKNMTNLSLKMLPALMEATTDREMTPANHFQASFFLRLVGLKAKVASFHQTSLEDNEYNLAAEFCLWRQSDMLESLKR